MSAKQKWGVKADQYTVDITYDEDFPHYRARVRFEPAPNKDNPHPFPESLGYGHFITKGGAERNAARAIAKHKRYRAKAEARNQSYTVE